ncbi:MAG: hypothetical protein SVT52_03030 [Planctomycetota bacterium]|nr:hypothetical protein [Planctomycetota bacterium]
MNEAAIRKKLIALSEEIMDLPAIAAARPNATEGVYQSAKSTSDLTVQDALDCLGLQVKYVLFDLEATRRENRYLRQMLETRPGRSDESGGFGFVK